MRIEEVKAGQRVTGVFYGVAMSGTVGRVGSGIVFVRWDGGRGSWCHPESIELEVKPCRNSKP